MNLRLLAFATSVCVATPWLAYAQGVATDQLIDSIVIRGERERLPVDVPNPTASQTREQLRTQNLINPEDALRYVPNLTIRKRYIGDRNALIGGRSFSTLQAPRGLVFMDGYLLSNFLGRFDAPRWNMIAPEEIERVDVLYGPYSAIYPGNSIGTTVVVATREPEEFELGVRTAAFAERYDEYGFEDDYGGYQISAFIGDRLANAAWWSLAANHQDSTSHPMQYYTVSANAAGEFPDAGGPGVEVSGVQFDRDPQGRRRAVFGANSGAVDHTIQNQVKLSGGYEFEAPLAFEGFIAAWRNDTENENRTFMRTAAGEPVWSGPVTADGVAFNVPLAAFAPSTRDEEHLQWGLTLRTRRGAGWNGSLVYSQYDVREDVTREASTPDPQAALGGAGTRTERDGTGWRTFEVQGAYAPFRDDWTRAHAIAVGYHQNEYELDNPVHAVSDWRSDAGVLTQNVFGRTQVRALYLQDVWSFAERWALTLGVRYEAWDAFDGGQRAGPNAIDYADRSIDATSPKASLAYRPSEDWTLRLSAGRGVRFPTVVELFQGSTSASAIVVNDPDLRAERSDSLDFTVERRFATASLRASLFEDDVADSIFTQRNVAVFPNVTNVQNIDRVRTRGVELAFAWAPSAMEALSLEGNVAYADAGILENANNPTYVGNVWPRVPDWRGALQAVWRPSEALTTSVGVRYSGRMYGGIDNRDVNPDVFGGVSRFTLFDARAAYRFATGVELALGVDNLTDERAYQHHPYPGRTALLEARYAFGDER